MTDITMSSDLDLIALIFDFWVFRFSEVLDFQKFVDSKATDQVHRREVIRRHFDTKQH